MLQGLFVNACILITFIFISSQIFRNIELSTKAPIGIKLKLGLIGGITASILIHFSIPIGSESIIEFRDISIILVAIFGGFMPTMIAGIITAIFRLTYYGINNTSIISFFATLIISFGCGLITFITIKDKMKWILLLFYSLIVRSVVYIIVLEGIKNELLVIFSSWISTIIISLIVYYVVHYLVTAHTMVNRLKTEATHDFLTGLNNTRRFDIKYNDIVRDTLEKKGRVSLLIIDIDHFKHVNDTYGHIAGDAVLKELGLVLLRNSRNDDVVSRIGGEEFAIVMKNMKKEETITIAERIRTNVESHPFPLPDSNIINITVSVGVAVYPDTIEDIKDLKETADSKLYEAKRTGRNKVCF